MRALLRLAFPTLASMEPEKLLMLPLAAMISFSIIDCLANDAIIALGLWSPPANVCVYDEMCGE